jgi:hypothetical protein
MGSRAEQKDGKERKKGKKMPLLKICSDNYNALVGGNYFGIVFSEWALSDPESWAYLRPILTENHGWALFISTPRGKNHAHRMYETALSEPDHWFSLISTVDDTDVISNERLAIDHREWMKLYGEVQGDAYFRQEYFCFPPDALVTCHDRVKPIVDIREGDSVLTHTGRFRRVERTMSRHYAGDMVRIESWGSRPIVCTPEHPIRVCHPDSQTYEWKDAKDIAEGDWLVTPRMEADCDGALISEALAKIIASYVCDGHVSGNCVSWSTGAHKPQTFEELTEALSACGFESIKKIYGPVVRVTVNSVVLGDLLVSQCGSLAHNKRLPLGLLRG